MMRLSATSINTDVPNWNAVLRTTMTMRREQTNQPKEGCAVKIYLTAAIDNDSVSGNDGKDASATTAMMPVQQGCWHGHNNGKDASNRGNVLCNNQPAQRKDEMADKRSGMEDMMRSQRGYGNEGSFW
jgi:hypothetical protein